MERLCIGRVSIVFGQSEKPLKGDPPYSFPSGILQDIVVH
jgi:hypothetical protein